MVPTCWTHIAARPVWWFWLVGQTRRHRVMLVVVVVLACSSCRRHTLSFGRPQTVQGKAPLVLLSRDCVVQTTKTKSGGPSWLRVSFFCFTRPTLHSRNPQETTEQFQQNLTPNRAIERLREKKRERPDCGNNKPPKQRPSSTIHHHPTEILRNE